MAPSAAAPPCQQLHRWRIVCVTVQRITIAAEAAAESWGPGLGAPLWWCEEYGPSARYVHRCMCVCVCVCVCVQWQGAH